LEIACCSTEESEAGPFKILIYNDLILFSSIDQPRRYSGTGILIDLINHRAVKVGGAVVDGENPPKLVR
jgi:hypothetical protein